MTLVTASSGARQRDEKTRRRGSEKPSFRAAELSSSQAFEQTSEEDQGTRRPRGLIIGAILHATTEQVMVMGGVRGVAKTCSH